MFRSLIVAGLVAAPLALAAPASAQPPCPDTSLGIIQDTINCYAQFPSNTLNGWASLPLQTVQNYAQFPSNTLNGYANFPQQTVRNYAQFPSNTLNGYANFAQQTVQNYASFPSRTLQGYFGTPH